MCQTQYGFQYAQQCSAGGALLGFAAVLNLYLGDFQIPVAIFIPYELVDTGCDVVETVVGKTFFYIGFRALQGGDDPLVGLRIIDVIDGVVCIESAILAFGIHQYKACCIP